MAVDLQKAGIWKRASALLLDVILLSILAVGFALLVSKITKFDSHFDKLTSYYSTYEEQYGVTFGITADEFDALPLDEQNRFNEASDALTSNKAVQKEFISIVNLSKVITSISILLAFIVLEIIVPLTFKNGMTVGKKIFALGVMTKEGVRLPAFLLVARTILGKFTIETMVPAFIIINLMFSQAGMLEVIILFAIPVIQLGIMIGTRTNAAIHDLVAGTVVIDFPSQRIFESQQELIKFQEERAREKAQAQSY